jgi:hypothetical protein
VKSNKVKANVLKNLRIIGEVKSIPPAKINEIAVKMLLVGDVTVKVQCLGLLGSLSMVDQEYINSMEEIEYIITEYVSDDDPRVRKVRKPPHVYLEK